MHRQRWVIGAVKAVIRDNAAFLFASEVSTGKLPISYPPLKTYDETLYIIGLFAIILMFFNHVTNKNVSLRLTFII